MQTHRQPSFVASVPWVLLAFVIQPFAVAIPPPPKLPFVTTRFLMTLSVAAVDNVWNMAAQSHTRHASAWPAELRSS